MITRRKYIATKMAAELLQHETGKSKTLSVNDNGDITVICGAIGAIANISKPSEKDFTTLAKMFAWMYKPETEDSVWKIVTARYEKEWDEKYEEVTEKRELIPSIMCPFKLLCLTSTGTAYYCCKKKKNVTPDICRKCKKEDK